MSLTPRIVIFDLDETLTQYDTFLPFITGYVREFNRRHLLNIWRLPLALLKFWNWGDRSWMKTEMLKGFVGGIKRQRLLAWTEHFVDELLASGMRQQGLQQLRTHQANGDRVILASASFDIYVERVAEKLGITEVLATRTLWDKHNQLVGMDGQNCRDQEKLRRIKALSDMPSDGQGVTAYSDSHADLPLLSWAESGIAVCPTNKLGQKIKPLGLELAQW